MEINEQTAQLKQGEKPIFKTEDSFVNFQQKLGVNPYAPDNSLSKGHYVLSPQRTRNRIELEAAYRGSWIVGKACTTYAEDMTRAGVTITTNEAAQDIVKMQIAMKRLKIWQSLSTLVNFGRLYGGAIAIYQIKGQKLDTPLDFSTVGKGQFKGLVVYDRWQLNPDLIDLISEGPDTGLPKYYNIVLGKLETEENLQAKYVSNGQVKVHHSRCIRMIGHELPYFQAINEMMWGESVLERFWDRLISFDTVTMSAANLVQRAYLRTIQVDELRQILSSGGDQEAGLRAMFEFVREMQNNEGLTILDKKDDWKTDTYSFAGLSDVMLQFCQQISGAEEIPLVVLFGQSPAGLGATAEADLDMYYARINSKQESQLGNPVHEILQLVYASTFGRPAPEDLDFTFNSLKKLGETEIANNTKTNAETVIAAHDQGALSLSKLMKELRSLSPKLFGNITDEDIADAENEAPPMPEAVPKEDNGEEPKASPAVKNIDAAFSEDDFSEGDHPRGNNGQFGSGGGGSSGSKASQHEPHEDVESLKKKEIGKLDKQAKGALEDLHAIGKKQRGEDSSFFSKLFGKK